MTQLKVYYLDDEADLCEIFEDYYASENVEVTTFTDPKAAVAAIKSTPPDLFFIDYRLEESNGDDVARETDAAIPKFLITGDQNVKTTYEFQAIIRRLPSARMRSPNPTILSSILSTPPA